MFEQEGLTTALRADGAVRLPKWKINLLNLGNSDTVGNETGIKFPAHLSCSVLV